jgi:hypothetical protein
VDALGLYAGALPPPTYATYIPNAGHGLGQPERMVAALSALWGVAMRDAASPAPLRWEVRRDPDRLAVSLDGPGVLAPPRPWVASGPTLDFRGARWAPAEPLGGGPPWTFELRAHPGACRAAFVEVEAALPHGTVPLDTPIWTLGQAGAAG